MNWKKHLLAFAVVSSAFVWGCEDNPYDIEFMVGSWKMQELKSVYYENGTKINDRTQTDSLPTWDLWATGQGLRTNFANEQDTFIWETNEKQEMMVIYYRDGKGPHMYANILEQTLDAKTIFWKVEETRTNPTTMTEYTAKIAKQ
ncbi:MAG: hypothetical protein U0176_16310 [Bacteroidia bacterium]